MAPHGARLLQGLPERRRWKAAHAGQEPNLEEHREHTFTQLVAHIVLDGGRGQQNLINCQQKEQQRLPGLSVHLLRNLRRLLESAQNSVTEHGLALDRVGAYKKR